MYTRYTLSKIDSSESLCLYHCGDDSGEVPPVLIPNTEVKLTSADNTLLETAREDRLLLHPKRKHPSHDGCFSFLRNNHIPPDIRDECGTGRSRFWRHRHLR